MLLGLIATVSLLLPRAEFQKYHEAITGSKLEEGALILKIDPAVSKSGCDAYTIVSQSSQSKKDNARVAITGSNLRSVFYGVYDLLERRGNCRWFWDGDIVPKLDKIDLTGLDIYEESRFEYRAIRYFAHRGLTRFQAEHWGLDDWKREIDWCLKRRVNCIMPRIGMDDTWQKAYPDIVPYPDPTKPIPEALKGYDNRCLCWPLEYRGKLRKDFTSYAFSRGLLIPTDYGTMTHWYSRTPQAFIDKMKPEFIPQASKSYGNDNARVFDIQKRQWLDAYWRLTEAFVDAGYGDLSLLHTIGLGERLVYKDRRKNLDFKIDVMKKLFDLASEKAPNAPILLAGWDFYFTWTPEEVKALLPHLDPKRVIIWDYEADAIRNWNSRFQRLNSNFTDWGVVGKFPYTFGIFLAYEQSLDIRANYPLIEERQRFIENDPMCKGYIFWPESSHTDIFALRYFTENAWRPGGKSSEVLLPNFCRDRYSKQAKTFESIWRKTIPIGYMNEFWGNYASYLTSLYCLLPKNNYNTYPMTQMLDRFRTANGAFTELLSVEWSDQFAIRDSIDLARTLLDRKIEMRRQQMVQAHLDWCKGSTNGDIVLDRAKRFAFAVDAMTKLLELHTDYSLWESYERLNAISPIVNKEYDRVLVDNAVNSYCRSHQYEAAANWYGPLAAEIANEVISRVKTDDKSDLPIDKFKKISQDLHDKMLSRKLEDMRPRADRTVQAFREIVLSVAD
jgi:hypothetical protein